MIIFIYLHVINLREESRFPFAESKTNLNKNKLSINSADEQKYNSLYWDSKETVKRQKISKCYHDGHTDILVDIYSFTFMKKKIVILQDFLYGPVFELEAAQGLITYRQSDRRTKWFLETAELFKKISLLRVK